MQFSESTNQWSEIWKLHATSIKTTTQIASSGSPSRIIYSSSLIIFYVRYVPEIQNGKTTATRLKKISEKIAFFGIMGVNWGLPETFRKITALPYSGTEVGPIMTRQRMSYRTNWVGAHILKKIHGRFKDFFEKFQGKTFFENYFVKKFMFRQVFKVEHGDKKIPIFFSPKNSPRKLCKDIVSANINWSTI